MKHLKFQKATMTKAEIQPFMMTVLEQNGWMNIASNESAEGYIYYSKGTSGEDDIYIQFRNGYNGQNGSFTTGNASFFDLRSMSSYEPSATGGTGTSVPSNSTTNYFYATVASGNGDTTYGDAEYDGYYRCRRNNLSIVFAHKFATTFYIVGRMDNPLNKVSKNTGNVCYGSHNGRGFYPLAFYGVADRAISNSALQSILIWTPIYGSLEQNGTKLNLLELGTYTALEGIRDRLEGFYGLSESSNLVVSNGDKIIDDVGNEYTIFEVSVLPSVGQYLFSASSTGSTSGNPIRHIAICTRLSGE